MHTNAQGSIHARVIRTDRAENAAKVDQESSGGGSEVSMEQLLSGSRILFWQIQKLSMRTITTDSVWAELNAVKEGTVYLIPSAPYSFMSNPPSVNRMIGILWLGRPVISEQYHEE